MTNESLNDSSRGDNMEEWGHPTSVSESERRLWAAMTAVWRMFAGPEPEPSLDLGGASRKGRTVTLDPFPRGVVDIRAVGEMLPFKDGVFKSVVVESVLKHVIRPQDVLSEARRVVAPGSLLFVTSPVNHTDQHRHSFSSRNVVDMLAAAGFEVIRKKGLGLFSRFLDRMLRKLGPHIYAKIPVPWRLCSVLMVVAQAV